MSLHQLPMHHTAILTLPRMARYGFAQPPRILDTAGTIACLITDGWEGLELFLEPGHECLTALNGDEVVTHHTRSRSGDFC